MLTERFDRAMAVANHLHNGQVRKGTQVPYVSHLMAVASLVLEDGGSEEEAIAALLHDAVEDQGGQATLEAIRAEFGAEVAEIVAGCSDTMEMPKPPWRERKEAYLRHLAEADEGTLRVSLADKVHNARSILLDLRQAGEGTWERFKGGKEGTLWYYRTLVSVFQERSHSPLVGELARAVQELERLARPEGKTLTPLAGRPAIPPLPGGVPPTGEGEKKKAKGQGFD